jgi:hypothetical protein
MPEKGMRFYIRTPKRNKCAEGTSIRFFCLARMNERKRAFLGSADTENALSGLFAGNQRMPAEAKRPSANDFHFMMRPLRNH